jgi:hypothetical protein
MLKRSIAILMLLLLFVGLNGYYLVFKIEQRQVRKEIKQKIKNKIPDNELHIIVVDASNIGEIEWEKENKEFKYHGDLFDIVRSEIIQNGTRYYCINDHQEKRLFTRLDELVSEQNDPANPTTRHLLKLLSFLIYLPTGSDSLYFEERFSSVVGEIRNDYHFDFNKEISHPPRTT